MAKISYLEAYWVLDSRGRPTVGCTVKSEDVTAKAFVPSGASLGLHEALEIRDREKAFAGFGVDKAIGNIKEIIAPEILGQDVFDQKGIDRKMIELDGTKNKSKLGANAILAVSLSCARLAAALNRLELFEYIAKLYKNPHPVLLPLPYINVINGGAHAKDSLDIQEFMLIPKGADSFQSAVQTASEIFFYLGEMFKTGGVGDEGGYEPQNLRSNLGTDKVKEVLEMLLKAVNKAGYEAGRDIFLGLDIAANHFYFEDKYQLSGQNLTSKELLGFYEELINNYPVISLEDGMAEQDGLGWKILTETLGNKIQLVGDDLFVTNPKLFQRGIEAKIANAIMIKLNQVGTLTETLEVIKMAQNHGYQTMIGNRSGETEDTTIADLAVGTNAGEIKSGSCDRGERTAKYNRLMEIERNLKDKAKFSG
ncbi:MAG: phosphopyruvate hydratase [Patescibacteria group bacterium]|nr:phosphopyruvate hydratase [Patescibacteria group bacterium]